MERAASSLMRSQGTARPASGRPVPCSQAASRSIHA